MNWLNLTIRLISICGIMFGGFINDIECIVLCGFILVWNEITEIGETK